LWERKQKSITLNTGQNNCQQTYCVALGSIIHWKYTLR
jgi:hypothetical protein